MSEPNARQELKARTRMSDVIAREYTYPTDPTKEERESWGKASTVLHVRVTWIIAKLPPGLDRL